MPSIMPVIDPIAATVEPTFMLFPKLALELRLMIWERSIPAARLIAIRGSGDSQNAIYPALRRAEVASSEVIPLIRMLQARHDSRRTMLKTYTLVFHNRLLAPIYIDFNRDALFFTDAYAIRDFIPFPDIRAVDTKEVQGKVQRIKLGFETWRSGIRNLEGLLHFRNLDRMVFEAGNDVRHTIMLKNVYKRLLSGTGKNLNAVERFGQRLRSEARMR